jgi:SAM-dependent methyltransferase
METEKKPQYKNADIETTSCPMCGGIEFQPVVDFSPFVVVECSVCGFSYLSPRLKEEAALRIYQENNYYDDTSQEGYSNYQEQELALRATYRRFFRVLKKHQLTGGDLLEIGCGFGFFLDEARPYFSKRMGTDFSPGARETAGLVADQIFLGGLEQIPAGLQVDAVVALNVLEHTYDPVKFLEAAKSVLKPGGKLIIAVPNMDSFIRKLMGKNWPSYKVPEHTLYFTQQSLDKVMREAGLAQVRKLRLLHAFPVSLIAGKFKIALPKVFSKIFIWVPSTMVAAVGVKNE